MGVELPASRWEYPVLQGAGALLSSGDDLLRFLEANLDPPATPVGDAIRVSHRSRHQRNDVEGVGLGWHLMTPPESRPNSSGAAAPPVGTPVFWALAARPAGVRPPGVPPPVREAGIVLLSNKPEPVDDLAKEILRLLVR